MRVQYGLYFLSSKFSVIFSELLGEENIGQILNEQNMPYCTRTHAITCLLLTQKIQCFLPFCLTSVLDFREENVKSKQSNAMVSKSEELIGSVLLLQRCLKAYFLHQDTVFNVGWMSKSYIYTNQLVLAFTSVSRFPGP